MRVPSGSTDLQMAFVAVDATDLKTRETGLSGFTVYRSRNGGAPVAYTTPTVTELSSANMPGVYTLLLDEDTTITAGRDEEEVVLHITQAAMAPVTRVIELYRPKMTVGNTLNVGVGGAGEANVTTMGTDTITAAAIAAGAVTEIQSGLATSAQATDIQSRIPAALTGGRMDASVGAVQTDAISAAGVSAAAANKVADHTLRRTYANARASSDGDAVSFRSLLGAVAKLVNKWSITGTTLTVTHEDDTTTAGTQTLTASPGADPISASDTV